MACLALLRPPIAAQPGSEQSRKQQLKRGPFALEVPWLSFLSAPFKGRIYRHTRPS
jgi:hypothetical protein